MRYLPKTMVTSLPVEAQQAPHVELLWGLRVAVLWW